MTSRSNGLQDSPDDVVRAPFVTAGMNIDDFCAQSVRTEWLVTRAIARSEELIVGGPDKSLKTGLLMDLCLSLASGTDFLGSEHFSVQTPVKTCIMSVESGVGTLISLALRITRARQVHVADIGDMLIVNRELPIIENDSHMVELEKYIKDAGIEVLAIDPAYLALFDVRTTVQASNLLQMGPLLRRLTMIRERTGVTLILAHHTRKRDRNKNGFAKTTREDLSQSGFSQWMRQWILTSRRQEFCHNGHHEIHLEFGGSAGQGGEYVWHVDEGKQDDGQNQVLTDWQSTLTSATEFKLRQKTEEAARAESAKDETLERHMNQVRLVLQDHNNAELSKTAISDASKLNPRNTGRALFELKKRGEVRMNDSNPNRVKWSLVEESDNPTTDSDSRLSDRSPDIKPDRDSPPF